MSDELIAFAWHGDTLDAVKGPLYYEQTIHHDHDEFPFVGQIRDKRGQLVADFYLLEPLSDTARKNAVQLAALKYGVKASRRFMVSEDI